MTYYNGKNLQNRIADFGLSELYILINQVAVGQANWPGTYQITPAEPELLEPIRVIIYSILHETGTKPMFTVKSKASTILVELKKQKALIAAGIIYPDQGQSTTRPGEVMTEDFTKVFDDSPLD